MPENQGRPQNKMGYMPINRLLLGMSLPIMISMLVQALYNIVDSMFVSEISEGALTAVTLAFPIQNLMIAIGTGTGVGINALLSRSLGEGNRKNASRAANNGVFLALCSCLLFVLFGFFFAEPFFRSQIENPSDPASAKIMEYGVRYLRICTIGSMGLFGQLTFERLLQSTGKTMYTMLTQSTGAILNIVLDYCLIFGKFGFPKLGVSGAAVATIIGQTVAMLLALVFNLLKNDEIKLQLRGFRPHFPTIGRIYAVGLPSILLASLASVMTFCMNKILISFSDTATAVFGVYFKLQSFIFMPVFGLNNGMVPIIAYNYGAGNSKRISKTMKLSILYAVSLMLLGLLLFQLIPDKMLQLFNASPAMLEIGVPALRTISLSYLFAGFCIISISSFQALGNGMTSLVISLTRQLVFLIPSAFLLSKTGKLHLIWFAFPIAECACVLLSAFFLRKIYRTKIRNLVPMSTDCEQQ